MVFAVLLRQAGNYITGVLATWHGHPAPSQADANNSRPVGFFKDLFRKMCGPCAARALSDQVETSSIDKAGTLTDKYYADKANGELKVAEEVADSAASVVKIIDSIYRFPRHAARKRPQQ